MEILKTIFWSATMLFFACSLFYRINQCGIEQAKEHFRKLCIKNPFISVENTFEQHRLEELLSLLQQSGKVDVKADYRTDQLHREYVDTSIFIHGIKPPLLGEINIGTISASLFGEPNHIPNHLHSTATTFFYHMVPVLAKQPVYVYETQNPVPTTEGLRGLRKKQLFSDNKFLSICLGSIIAAVLSLVLGLFYDDCYYNGYADLQRSIDLLGWLPEHTQLKKIGVVFGAASSLFSSIFVYLAGIAIIRACTDNNWNSISQKGHSLILPAICCLLSQYVSFFVDFGLITRPLLIEAQFGYEARELLESICYSIKTCYPQTVLLFGSSVATITLIEFSTKTTTLLRRMIFIFLLVVGIFLMAYHSATNLWYTVAYLFAIFLLVFAIAAINQNLCEDPE